MFLVQYNYVLCMYLMTLKHEKGMRNLARIYTGVVNSGESCPCLFEWGKISCFQQMSQ